MGDNGGECNGGRLWGLGECWGGHSLENTESVLEGWVVVWRGETQGQGEHWDKI